MQQRLERRDAPEHPTWSGLARLLSAARMKRLAPSLGIPKANMPPPGTAPGIETTDTVPPPNPEATVRITCVDYCPERTELHEITDPAAFLTHHRPSWCRVRWINIAGTGRVDVIRQFGEKYQLHPLSIEDVAHGAHRPKVEDYPASEDNPGRLFIVARLLHLRGGRLFDEQFSLFLGRTTLVTFQEHHTDIFESIYRRIQVTGSRLRENDVSFLCYALLDSAVDSYFPLLEHYSERLEEVEDELMDHPSQTTMQKAHLVKRSLVLLRRAVWPMRELIARLVRDKHECLSDTTLTYFRDVYDHCVQIIDLIETYHEIAAALTETYMSVVSNRMNEIMKVLTVISTIFIPLTFLAGVYGMNMPIPENHWHWSYPVFWGVCALIALVMLLWFRRRGWV